MANNDPIISSTMDNERLIEDLSSYSGEKRLKALQVLSSKDENPKSIYKLCLKAEEIVVSPTNFREKLCLLQKLNSSKLKSLENDEYNKAAIRFLFGSLYVNFTPLWKDISSLIQSFATSDKQYLGNMTQEKIDECQSMLNSEHIEEESKNPTVDDVKRNRPDFVSYRVNLLSILEKFTYIVEPYKDWFLQSFFSVIENKPGSKVFLKNAEKRDSTTIIAYLRVLANLSSINSLQSIDELKHVLDQFLVSTNPSIQEAAFNVCALIHSKSLKRYKSYFLRVIDDKTMKEQLLELNINAVNEEDRMILEEHRTTVIPFLFRILTGKMASNTSQKYIKSSQDKKDIIMRFVSGCPVREINFFFDLNLLGFNDYIDQDYPQLIQTWTNPSNFKGFSISRMKECLNFLSLTLNHFVNITQEILPTVIKYFAIISLYSKTKVSMSGDSKSEGKELRKSCIKLLVMLFQEYDHYSFSEQEINFIFVSLITPTLETFAIDSIGNSTPLLQLFLTWSENSKFFNLLSLKKGMELSSFEVLMKVFENDKTSTIVQGILTKIISNLLQLDDVIAMNQDSEKDTTGISLVKPFVTLILNRFQCKFDGMKKKKKFKIEAQELMIVRTLVDLVENPENCNSLSILLLEIFKRQHSSCIDSHQEILGTIHTLSIRANNKSSLMSTLAPLFSKVTPNESRTLLCKIVKDLSSSDNLSIVDGLCSINSFSPKYVEEPDYEKRLDGYRALEKISQNLPYDQESFLLLLECVIYSCIYTLQHFVLDMSLRESSSSLLEKIVISCCASKDKLLFKRICENIIVLRGVKQLMSCDNESVRVEAVTVLIPILNNGKGFSSDIDKLSKLQNETEPEVDFWLNVKHIQVHRRARAFVRLAGDHNMLSQLGSQVLWNFILPFPLANLTIVDNAKVGPNSASIELIGSICRFLEWNKYESLVKSFLKRLQSESNNLNVLVRVISAILSNFNYDLSTAQLNDEPNQDDLMQICSEKDAPTDQNDDNAERMEIEINTLIQKLDSSKATIILTAITTDLLPSLNKCLYELNYSDFDHDRMKKEFNEEDQVQKIPIAMAIVKLLLVLPEKFKLLENNIQGIFLRLCHFLKSKAVSIREVARKSLKSVMKDLGVSYLPFLLAEMNHTLVRGYQRHVLSYSIHDIVSSLLPSLKSGDLDESYELLCTICLSNITGDVAQEKEVDKIVGKTKEAKKNKSFDLLYIMALVSSPQTIPILVSPLKQKLIEARIYKDIKRVSDSLHKLFTGFLDNTSIPVEKLLTLVYGIASETVLESKSKQVINEKKVIKAHRLRQDSLLIGKQLNAPKKVKSTGGNQYGHVLVVESFYLLQCLLEKERLKRDSLEHLALLDPFIPLMNEYLISKQTPVIASVVKCLHHLIRDFTNLPSFKVHGNVIKNRLFLLISHNNSMGASEGENGDISNWCFKTIGVLITGFDFANIDDDQLKVIICHIESGLISSNYQVSTFLLLKSIITRRLEIQMLPSLMERVGQLAIQSEVDHVRKHCWQSWLKYFLFYPHGKKFNTHLQFWITQIEYEYESGRMSALEILHGLVKNLPQKLLQNNQNKLIIPLSLRFVYEDSIKCKNKVNEIVSELMRRISHENRNEIFKNLVIPWMSQMDIRMRQVAIHLVSIYVHEEGQKFEQRLSAFMPLFQQQMDPSRYSQQEKSKQVDNFVFSSLSLFHKMIVTLSPGHTSNPADTGHCGQKVLTFSKESPFNDLWNHVESFYLEYPHIWVRFMSAKLFGHLFSGFSHQEVAERIMEKGKGKMSWGEQEEKEEEEMMKGEKEEEENDEKNGEVEKKEFLLSKPWLTLPSLTKSFFSLFEHVYDLQEDFPEQLLQNLEFVTDVILYLHLKRSASPDTFSIPRALKLESLLWNIRQRIRREMKIAPHETLTRHTMFKLMAKIASCLDAKNLDLYAEQLILPLFREVSDNSSNRDNEQSQRQVLVTLAQQVLNVIEAILGPDSFRTNYTKAQVTLQRMRVERKKHRALTIANDPSKGLLMRQKKNLSKKRRRMKQAEAGIQRKRRKVIQS